VVHTRSSERLQADTIGMNKTSPQHDNKRPSSGGTLTLFALIVTILWGCESKLTVATNGKGPKPANQTNPTGRELSPTTVSGISSPEANGSYRNGRSIRLTVNFSEIVSVTGSPKLLLNFLSNGLRAQAKYNSGSGTSTLTFIYDVQPVDRSLRLDCESTSALQLNSGSIVDTKGKDAVLTLPKPGQAGSLAANKFLIVDNDEPTISNLESLTVAPGQTTPAIPFQIDDATSPLTCSSASLSMTSSNKNLVSDSSVVWSGTYPNCSAKITANSGSEGTTMITFTLTDPAGAATTMDFPLFVSNAYVYGQDNPQTDGGFYSRQDTYGSVEIQGKIYSGGYGRIFVWNSMPTENNQPADFQIGTFSSKSSYRTKYNNELLLSGLIRVATDGTNLVASDATNHRILIWNTAPTNPRVPPDLVLGQSDFSVMTANRGGTASASTLYAPQGVLILGGKLYVCDTGNNRVLIWNSIPKQSGAPADVVIGQPDFTTTSGTTGSTKLYSPNGLASNGKVLAVMDSANNRIMIWNQMPISSGTPADLVVGQLNFTSAVSGAPTLSQLNGYVRGGIAFYQDKLLVGDVSRILVWNTVPTTIGQPADYVLGQASGTAMVTNLATSWSMNNVYGLSVIGQKVIVGDASIFYPIKTLIWNSLPLVYNADFSIRLTGVSTASQTTWRKPTSVYSDGTRIFGVNGNAVYIWNTVPASKDIPPDLVLGQPDFDTDTYNYGGVSATSLGGVSAVLVVGTKLIVADGSNNRVLIWNSIPTVSNQAADVVIGQANFVSNSQNRGGSVAANTLAYPSSVSTDGTKLLIADKYNYRVLVYNTVPTTNGASANVAIGQSNLSSATNSSASQTKFSGPTSILVAQNKLYLCDSSNNRILVWNSIPTTHGAAADAVLGQSSFTGNTANAGGISASTLYNPYSLAFKAAFGGSYLFVSDSNNNRIVYWPATSITTGAPATGVMFQPNFTTNIAHGFGLGHSPFDVTLPGYIAIIGGNFWVAEWDRVLVTTLP
jgi:hypothetical protein